MAIAVGANVSHSTVMFHFRSKPGLYAAAVALAGERFFDAIRHEGTQSFPAMAQRWIDHLLDESSGYRLLCWLDDHQQPEIRAAAQSVRDRLAGVWCDWLAERVGRYWPPTKRSTVAILIVTVVTGLPAVASHQRQQATGALKLLERLIETDWVSYGSDDLPAAAE